MSGAARARPQRFTETEFAANVVDGLGQSRKRLEAKHFYDEAGLRLFDRICELEE